MDGIVPASRCVGVRVAVVLVVVGIRLIVRTEEWKRLGRRQLTGTTWRYHAIIGAILSGCR